MNLGDSWTAWNAVAESGVLSQVVTLEEYYIVIAQLSGNVRMSLPPHCTPDMWSCRCAVHETAGTINLSTKCKKKNQKEKTYKILLNVALPSYNALLNTMLQKYKEILKVTFKIRGFASGIVVGCYKFFSSTNPILSHTNLDWLNSRINSLFITFREPYSSHRLQGLCSAVHICVVSETLLMSW
jgi:hypothetical protein